jgi:hypothetical protein
MRSSLNRALWMAAAVAGLATGCVVDNPAPRIDAGEDAGDPDQDGGADADSDSDGTGDAGTYLACDENGDICRYATDGEEIGVVEECPPQNSVCAETDGGAPECQCVEHFDLATDCVGCETGYGGEACAVCEIGYGGEACDECVGAFVSAGGACVYGGLCGSDALWLEDGALPGTTRPDGEFAAGGTVDEITTVDLVTGLEWQRCPTGTVADGNSCSGGFPEAVSHEAALAHCMAPFGGYDDWRLPEASELQSLFDYGVAGHANAFFLPGYANEEVWTSTEVPGPSTHFFAVRFSDLAAAEPDDGMAYGLCVRDVDAPISLVPRFAVGAADGSTVVDLWADREWRRCIYGQTWAGSACAGEWKPYEPYGVAPAEDDVACDDAFGGHTDWRVPDAAEMASLLEWCDETRPYALEAFAAPLTPSEVLSIYWTSTADPDSGAYFYFDLLNREAVPWPVELPGLALCVRDPG